MSMNDEQEKLVIDNMTLVHFIISKYYPTFCGNEDVIQSGMVGLCKAANTWKSSKSTFSTYASKCILNEIKRYFREIITIEQSLSLEYEYEGGMTLSEAIEGDGDVESTFEFKEFMESEDETTRLIVALLAQGYNSKEISDMIGIKRSTVAKVKRLTYKKWEGIE